MSVRSRFRAFRRHLAGAFKALGVPLPGAGGDLAYDVYPKGGPWWDKYRKPTSEGNSIVMAAVGWAARTFPEAPLKVWDRNRDGDSISFNHDLQLLVETPNPHYAGPLLWMGTIVDFILTGNAYWLKVRSGRGVVELWWLPSALVEPKWDSADSYIDWYDYRPKGESIRLDQADVVHFRYGLDGDNPRKGKSPLAAVLSEILTDQEATRYTQTILKNLGVPGVVLSPDEDTYASDDELNDMKDRFMERTTGSHRGEPLILTRKTNISILSFSPEQLGLKDLQRLPEERITAVLGLPAIIAGLGAGLDRSTFSNYAEAREAAYDDFITPMQRLLAAEIQTQLLPDFSRNPRLQRVGFDTSEVKILQEDQNKLALRLVTLVEGGLLTPNEARAKIGAAPADDDKGDSRLRKGTLKYVDEVEPDPTPPQLPGAGVPLLTDGTDNADGADGGDAADVADDANAKQLTLNIMKWMSEASRGT